jgi:hypothetical protein
MKKTVLVMVIITAGFMYAQLPKTLRQMVRNWPDNYDNTGMHWIVYYIDNAKDSVLYDTSLNSVTLHSTSLDAIRWNVECSDFGGPPYGGNDWSSGDSLIAFGSWDSAYYSNPAGYGDNINHVASYWLFSDVLDTQDPQTLSPDDTLRIMAKPTVWKTGAGGSADDTVWIEITNPMETRRGDQSGVYDVLGFWIWADTTSTGTPNAYNASTAMEIAFVPVNGGIGGTTTYWRLESDGFEGWHTWTTYFGYKIVARPDTTSGDNPDCPGHATYYFSQNSDPIDIYQNVVGIEEQDVAYRTVLLSARPNPFVDRSSITFSVSQTMPVLIKLYDIAGNYVSTVLDKAVPAGVHSVDVIGDALPGGVYFYQVLTPDKRMTGRLVKL